MFIEKKKINCFVLSCLSRAQIQKHKHTQQTKQHKTKCVLNGVPLSD